MVNLLFFWSCGNSTTQDLLRCFSCIDKAVLFSSSMKDPDVRVKFLCRMDLIQINQGVSRDKNLDK